MSPAPKSAAQKLAELNAKHEAALQALKAEVEEEISSLEAEIEERQAKIQELRESAGIGAPKAKGKPGRKAKSGDKPDDRTIVATLKKLGATSEANAVGNDKKGLAGALGVESRIVLPSLNRMAAEGVVAFSGVRRGTVWWVK